MAITTVHNELIAVNAISGTLIADNAITATHIATNAVSGTLIADNAVTTVHIAANNVTSTSIVANAITSTQLADNAVTATKIPDGTALTLGATTMNGALTLTSSASDSVFLTSSQSTTTNVYIRNSNATTNNTANLYFAPANNVAGSLIQSIAREDFSTSANRTADLAFSVRKDGTMAEKMRILSDGNVGIGTTSPTSPLHISSATNRTLLLDYTAGSGGYTWASFKQSGTEKFRVFGDYTAGYLSFYNETQSAHQLTLASDGKVGIGNDSPAQALQVTSSGFAYGRFNNSSYTGIDIGQHTGGDVYLNLRDNKAIRFQTNNTERLVISNSGNISTHPPAGNHFVINENGVDSDFRVESDGNAHMLFVDGGNNRVGIGTASPSRQLHLNNASDHGIMSITGSTSSLAGVVFGDTADDDVSGIIHNNSGNYLYFNTSSTERMRITSDGDVTIGSGANVGTAGTRTLNVGTTSSSGGLQLFAPSGNAHGINFGDAYSSSAVYAGAIEYNHPSDYMRFFTAATERMRIDGSGNVSIGGTDAQAIFNVRSTADAFTGHFINHNASTPYGIKVEYTGGSPNSNSNYWFLYAEDTTEAKAKLRSNGYFYLAGTAYGSDRELKENIVDTPDSLAKLKQIKVRDFNLKGQSEKHTGVIAQEIESLFPDLLGEEVISKEDAEEDKNIKTVEYNGLIGILIKSVQELEARLAALE